MGFCLFGNLAVAAAHALEVHGLERVFVLDWDVHHGNGTNEIFSGSRKVLFASLHQWPLYPGTGARAETGAGNIVNAPLPAGAGSIDFRDAFNRIVLPALDDFAPQLVIVSASIDAHRHDLRGHDVLQAPHAPSRCIARSRGLGVVPTLSDAGGPGDAQRIA
jgi:acetoin utilization deacetylase AcuC-like enzyme